MRLEIVNKSQLEQKIKEKEIQIAKLRDNVDLSPVCADLYNKAVLEKAILKDELKKMSEPILSKVSDKIRTVLPFGEKRICDYFRG